MNKNNIEFDITMWDDISKQLSSNNMSEFNDILGIIPSLNNAKVDLNDDATIDINTLNGVETKTYKDGNVVSNVPWAINTKYIRRGVYNVFVEYTLFGTVGSIRITLDSKPKDKMVIVYTPELTIDIMKVDTSSGILVYDSNKEDNKIIYTNK